MRNLRRLYFEWLCEFVENDYIYTKLFNRLFETEFTYILDLDENRAMDGIDLRYSFIVDKDYPDIYVERLDGPCSVFEMMVALARRCELTIMDDPSKGDRTSQWFWAMINSLGLSGMHDDNFDSDFVDMKIEHFLNREYDFNGKGGLFTVKNAKHDLRDVEIWCQLCWYLDDFIGY